MHNHYCKFYYNYNKLLLQLPTNVCPYQYINISIVVREQWHSDLNQNLSFNFRHRGSGKVKHRIISGLKQNKRYSVHVVVESAVGDCETSTNFGKSLD